MKCRSVRCKRTIPDNSIFCPWCGFRQVLAADEVKVPQPKRKGNKWYAQMMVGDQRVYISEDSEEEYYAKARAAKKGLLEIKKAAPKLSLGTAIDNYIKDNDQVLSPSTINAYKSYRKTRFQQFMGDDVELINWQRMINEESKSKSAKTVHNAWRLVTASLRHADREVPKVNLPRKKKSERPWLDYQQIQILLAKCKGKPYELGIILALHGLRRSEILHLSSDDVDTEAGLIHIRGASVIGSDGKLVDKDTNKNISSTRDVHIAITRLNELIRGKEGRLVTTYPSTLYGLINDLCRANNLPEVGVHGLRHSYISLCFHLGWNPQTVMREGGYSNLQTVNDVYRHLAAADADDDISKLREFMVDIS